MKNKNNKKNALKIISNVIFYVLLAIIIALLVIVLVNKYVVKDEGIFGYFFGYVETASMEPDLKVGQAFIAKNIESTDELEVGQWVRILRSDNVIVIHELTELYTDETTGELMAVTWGRNRDMCAVPDKAVPATNVYQIYVAKIPLVGLIYKAVNSIWGFLILIFIPLLYLLIAEVVDLARKTIKAKMQKEEQFLLQESEKQRLLEEEIRRELMEEENNSNNDK